MERPDSLDTSDVAGAKSRQLPVRRTQHPFNTNLDIDRSQPLRASTGADYPRHQRCTNPLVPEYRSAGFEYEPLPKLPPPRDIMWTLPQKTWKPAPRQPYVFPAEEVYSREKLYLQRAQTRHTSLGVYDITGPQTRIEEPRWRKTDPLLPRYQYDGAVVEDVPTRRRKYGSHFPRAANEAYGLRTDDISTGESIFSREYPKELIKTRPANRTDDIDGAQAGTRAVGPKVWRSRDPHNTVEKLMSHSVFDIEGAVTGTAGHGIKVYRARKQQAAVERGIALVGQRAASASSPSLASFSASLGIGATLPPPTAERAQTSVPAQRAAAERQAEIDSVRALG